MTEWRNRPLTESQIRYAFDDVLHLIPLWEKLSSGLKRLNRVEWAKEEFTRLVALAAPETNSSNHTDKWRKLRGIGSLDRRRLAVVRALHDWREEEAARNNRPARTIVRDDLLVEIARRNPTKIKDLQVVRGLPKRSLDDLLEVVEQARSIPLHDCPHVKDRDQDPPQLALATHILTAALGDLCIKKHLASNLVASNHDLKLLARCAHSKTPLPNQSLLSQGWRAQHVLPDLQAILEGKRSLRITNLRAPDPLDYSDAHSD